MAKLASIAFLALVTFAFTAASAEANTTFMGHTITADPINDWGDDEVHHWGVAGGGALQVCGGDDLPSCEDFGLPVFTGPSISDGLQICPASGGGDGCPPPVTVDPVCFFDCDTDDSTDVSGAGETPVVPEDEEDTLPDPVAPVVPEEDDDVDNDDSDDAPSACEQLQATGARIGCGGDIFFPTPPDSDPPEPHQCIH
ncbi:MAG: hypothetical protein VX963_03725 [Actinomycetota bacterium]|nr:hypothetical protein [Actinomycetota bacterium]